MTKKEIALKYLDYLQQGDIHNVVELFSADGIVDSPIYGIKRADEFYIQLNNDTKRSELNLKGIFEQQDSNNLALYFSYKWTLKNNDKVEFDVVDIIEFDSNDKIKTLKIIYDTVDSRKIVESLQ